MINHLSLMCKFVYGSRSKDVEKGLKFRLKDNQYIPNGWGDAIIDRIKLVIKTIILPFEFIYNKNISCKGKCRLIFGVGTKEDIYEGCIRHYFGGNVNSVYDKHYYKEAKEDILFWKWYFKFLIISIMLLFDTTRHSYGFLISVYRNVLSVLSIRRMVNGIYGFYIYNPISYLTMACLTGNRISRVYAMFEVFLEMNKYFRLPVEKGYFLSKIMLEEIGYYNYLPAFRLNNYEYLGSINLFGNAHVQNYKYDIGFFSTGAWARKKGEDRALEDFRSVKIGDSDTARYEHDIFCALAEYAKKNGFTIKYYMHPYEKDVFKEYGVLPIDHEKKDNESVFFEEIDDRMTLTERFDEPYIAVAVRSSSIMERYNLGHSNNFMFDYKEILPCTLARYNRKALGKYDLMFYKNVDELIEKIGNILMM